MSETTENVIAITTPLTGRKEIQTSVTEITAENVGAVLSQAYIKHLVNKGQIEYLYKYYKGDQPVLHRIKEIRPEICNHVVENRANAIVATGKEAIVKREHDKWLVLENGRRIIYREK